MTDQRPVWADALARTLGMMKDQEPVPTMTTLVQALAPGSVVTNVDLVRLLLTQTKMIRHAVNFIERSQDGMHMKT